MSGPQVIEVVVIDSDINDTDEAKGEPDVTVNGKKLRMVQAVDGNWYGYFADKTMATTADQTVVGKTTGEGLDFGTFCSSATLLDPSNLNVTVSETVGIAVGAGVTGGTQGTTSPFTACTTFTAGDTQNVIREQKAANGFPTSARVGQIGIDADVWPFIQLYTLTTGGNVVIQYNKGGGVQTTTLTFDTVDQFSGVSLDRTTYPQKAQVHATITDLWLNIDPTDEDSWTFGANSTNSEKGTYYQVFNENGGSDGDQEALGVINIDSALGNLMCEDNCRLLVNVNKQGATNPVLTLQDNGDTVLLLNGTDANLASKFQVNNTDSTNAGGPGHTFLGINTVPVTITEQGPNSGIFGTYDESDNSVLKITSNAARGTSATVDYNASPVTVLVGFGFATVDIQPTDAEWTSGEEIPVVIVDNDANKNSRADEDLDLFDTNVTLIPALQTGDPFTLGEAGLTAPKAIWGTWQSFNGTSANTTTTLNVPATGIATTISVDKFSERAILTQTGSGTSNGLVIDLRTTIDELRNSIRNPIGGTFHGFNFLNLDLRSLNTTGTFDVYLLNSTGNIINTATNNITTTAHVSSLLIADNVNPQSLTLLNSTATNAQLFDSTTGTNQVGLLIVSSVTGGITTTQTTDAIVVDFFSFGYLNDGLAAGDRVANQIVRIEAEETGDNTSTFAGSLEFVMINQLNILDVNTYSDLTPIADDPNFIVIEDLTDEDSPRVNYNDLGADGVTTQVADQQAAPSHSGVVSFNAESYKNADTVIITLQDLDLNVDSDLVDIYTTISAGGSLRDVVGSNSTSTILSTGDDLGRLLDVTFDDQKWTTPTVSACATALSNAGVTDTGLAATGFTLVETGPETGIFVGDFQIPGAWCRSGSTTTESVTGLDIEVNYVDFRDASGEVIEVGDGAGVRANTGSVSLDRTVYPVPFGVPDNFSTDTDTTPDGRSLFPIHQTGMNTAGTARSGSGLQSGEFIGSGDLTIHVRVNDPDFNTSASGEDIIGTNSTAGNGPVKISVLRGSSAVVLGFAGGPAALAGTIDTNNVNLKDVRQFGPMGEIAPDAGIFESDIVIRYTDGPASTVCPSTTSVWTNLDGSGTAETDRFDVAATTGDYCILQGDILQVEYTDPADASGDINTVTDSATFDLRNGVLQSDKSVYIIGSDMILTLIEPDFDLDNDQAETYDLDLIEWDSDAATVTMGDADGQGANFDPEPSNFRETGDSTGIFQIVVEIPSELDGDKLERGEEIVLEYSDWGPSGSDYVGDEDEDVNLTLFTSNFGATVELDQKVYTWTDKVYITIVAPDHNFDSNLVDEIGDTNEDPIKVSTRGNKLNNYKLVETGTDTGIFTGEVILTGFTHNADGDTTTGTNGNDVTTTSPSGTGPTDGLLPADDDDGITISFEFSEDETIVGSALIRWNIGEVQWLEASYPASGTGVVRVIDPDMNLNPEAVDNFNADVWSDSDAGGIDLTVTETNEATGIFEGTVFFTTTDESSGHRLRVAEGDTVTAEYSDNTLPNPYTTADELDITATSLIGTVVPPLERAPAANLRVVDAFGNSLSTVNVDQQVQITADLANGQDREQAFAYLVQIQDGNGVTVSLAWITGSLSAGQSFSPALSWIPTDAGTYTATAFVWESVDNPTALSPPVTTTIIVQ
ncbi:Putative PKD domain protein [Nitrosarchaeum koreense MY1]|uniref:Putative PKD domain protein n=2 Tax=Nitrosarchaeum TaxID=1007082 RepID=F9CYL9_9ARCH|nr:Putative PKD domain protein [Nitrosarchaeum koreense MY1]